MRLLITGSKGQLGNDLIKVLSDFELIPATRDQFDITDLDAVINFFRETKPEVVIHTAAYTDVDGCETNKDLAFKVNALGTRNVAIAAQEVNATLFYISTDYVFDGKKKEPYLEFDAPNPISVYGQSKFAGENFVIQQTNRFFILRIAWLYGQQGKNFVKTMLRLGSQHKELKVVNDQHGSPTWTLDVANQIKRLLFTKAFGVYHCTSQGSCSWYEFAKEIFKQVDLDVNILPVSTEEFPRPACRPKNSVLENCMLKLQGLDIMPHWRESLKRFLKQLQNKEATSP